jgi:hypothetical protein
MTYLLVFIRTQQILYNEKNITSNQQNVEKGTKINREEEKEK